MKHFPKNTMPKRALAFLTGLLSFAAPAMAREADWPAPIDDNAVYNMVLFDQLEYRAHEGADTFEWDAQGWIGTDWNKLWVKTEGGVALSGGRAADLEVQALYSRMIAPFWDVQAGLRYDRVFDGGQEDRVLAVIGVQGLAPYRFEVEPALFISADGDVSARLAASYDLLFTQRLILQPRFESNVAVQRVRRFGVGRGLNDVQIEARLRYEIRREFAPYLGVSWTRKIGDTANLAEAAGEDVGTLSFVAGLRLWF